MAIKYLTHSELKEILNKHKIIGSWDFESQSRNNHEYDVIALELDNKDIIYLNIKNTPYIKLKEN